MAETKKLAIGGLLIAVGILLPQVFHLAGGSAMGGLFLPMHLPVLLGGFLLGPAVRRDDRAADAACQQPADRYARGGDAALYGGGAAGIRPGGRRVLQAVPAARRWPAWRWRRRPGRLVKALLLAAVGLLGVKAPPAASVFAAVLEGLPGLAVQWTAIPLLLTALRKSRLLESPAKRKKEAAMSDWELARSRWEAENAACAVCRNGQVRVSHLTGIRPLLAWLGEDANALRDGAAADKIVGRAAALLFLYGRRAGGIRRRYQRGRSGPAGGERGAGGLWPLRPLYHQPEKTGLCPMEQRVRDIQDPAAAYEALAAQADGRAAP